MKAKRHIFIHVGILALMAPWLFAIEAPEDNAPPPPLLEKEADEIPAPIEEPAEQPQQANAFLGLVTLNVPEALATHLLLEPNEGVMVSELVPDSPATKSGINTHDVITRVADNIIRNREDLSRIVSEHKPGDTLRVEIIQKGQKNQLDVVLGERPADIMMGGGRGIDHMILDGLPADQANRLRNLIEQNLGAMDAPGAMFNDAAMEEAMREMRNRMGRVLENGIEPEQPRRDGIHFQADATIRLMDEKGSVEIKSNNDGKEVTVRDNNNAITWTGPWDTDQDKAAAPDDVRERVDRLNFDHRFKGPGIRFRFRGGEPAPDER